MPGFSSKDVSRRDEFMSHVRTEQYRETWSNVDDICHESSVTHDAEDVPQPDATIMERLHFIFDLELVCQVASCLFLSAAI
jgi:hypothetical protein